MTTFQLPDSNVWYQITNLAQGFNSSLQWDGFTLSLIGRNPGVNPFWQFLPSSNGSYQIRNKEDIRQLTACYEATESAPGNTQPCMKGTTNDTSQEWNISPWADGTFRLTNVANGTGYNMDHHPGIGVYMSASVVDDPVEPGQHLEIKSLGNIDDGAYSTAFPKVSTLA
jgi:hypothetical protein